LKPSRSLMLNAAHSIFPRVETLIIESTYGGPEDFQPSRDECEKKQMDIIGETIARKGKVLIPSLGVGRAQEIMLVLEKAQREEGFDLPVYVDGMIWDVAAVHAAYPRFMADEVKEKVFYEDKNPLLNPMFKKVGSGKERQEIIDGPPCVILATSGMLTGGPSVQYFKQLADNPKNSVIFVNYQAEGSPGYYVQRGDESIKFDEGETVHIKLQRHTISGFSGHADHDELIDYVKKLKPRPKKVMMVHGESSKTLNMASTLHKTFKIETLAPKNLEVIRLR